MDKRDTASLVSDRHAAAMLQTFSIIGLAGLIGMALAAIIEGAMI